jgi:S-adenosylmethionine hydrolase
MGQVITLTTDFGTQDAYVGVMKGVILRLNPEAQIVDLSHEIPPQGIQQAAFLLSTSFRYFPEGTIHLAVVDPGVGGERRALAARSGDAYFVAPDNGALSYVASRGAFQEVVELTNSDFWLSPVSNTFHGRDVLAPVAAHLSLGVELARLGESVVEIVSLPMPSPEWKGPRLAGQVVYIDRFGNLVTDIPAEALPSGPYTVHPAERAIPHLHRTYCQVVKGETLAYIGSSGFMEIAVREGSAKELLRATVGTVVTVQAEDNGS